MELNKTEVIKAFQSKTFKRILWGIGILIIVLIVFAGGMFVGFKKANFSFRWGERYHENFGGPRGGFFKEFSGGDYIEGHGVFGQIIKIDASSIAIKGADNAEKVILINEDTAITSGREKIKSADLKVDDSVVIIGTPNDAGQIEAKLIRLMPQPLANMPGPRGGRGAFMPPLFPPQMPFAPAVPSASTTPITE